MPACTITCLPARLHAVPLHTASLLPTSCARSVFSIAIQFSLPALLLHRTQHLLLPLSCHLRATQPSHCLCSFSLYCIAPYADHKARAWHAHTFLLWQRRGGAGRGEDRDKDGGMGGGTVCLLPACRYCTVPALGFVLPLPSPTMPFCVPLPTPATFLLLPT